MTLQQIKDKYPNRNIGFKATNSDMTCLDYKYSLNEVFKHDGEIQPCRSGFHLCNNPIDTLRYYDNIFAVKRFFIVEYGHEFIEHHDKLVTNEITLLEEINILDFIQDNKDSFTQEDWNTISQYQKLSEDFIREHKDLVYWPDISLHQTLSEDLIREHRDLVDWNWISHNQTLSEDFIREHKDLVNWYWISRSQKLSEDFIREHKDLVSWYWILSHPNIIL